MAKRAPANETPYSPLDADLARSVMDGVPASVEEKASVAPSASKETERLRKPRPARGENEKVVEHPTVKNSMAPDAVRIAKRLCREKRVLLTAEEERQIERLVDRIGEDLGTSLKLSHLLRACMTLLCHAEGELHVNAATLGPLIRPANGDAIALAQFEFDLAKLLSKALRDAPPLRQ
jgi:hypothetical protein